MTEFRLRTLGYPEIDAEDGPRKLGLRKGLALLVYLAEAGGPVGRDALATLLWPQSATETVRTRLRRLLHRVQAALGENVFETDGTTVRWSTASGLQVDADLFEAACDRGDFEQACQLYKSDFLDGFSPGDAPEFDEWAFFRREALRGRMVQALERVVRDKNAAGDYAAAAIHAGRLAGLDPFSEVYGRHLIRNLLLAGDRASAERHFTALSRRLRDELDVEVEAETRALMRPGAAGAIEAAPPTRYAHGGGVHLAYQVHGSGAVDILLLPGFVSHVERSLEEPHCRAFVASLTAMGRLIMFDRRGIGLSDRIGFAPSPEATARDIETVLDAAGSRRAVLFGASESGPACITFAAAARARVAGLILFGSLAKGSWAPDYPHALRASQYDVWSERLVAEWGGPAGIETFAPSLAKDPQARAWWAGLLRAASSPGAVRSVLEALRDTDVRHLLAKTSAPTLVLHRRGDAAVRIDAGRHLASQIAQAKFVELEGNDHWFFAGEQSELLNAVREFIRGLQKPKSS